MEIFFYFYFLLVSYYTLKYLKESRSHKFSRNFVLCSVTNHTNSESLNYMPEGAFLYCLCNTALRRMLISWQTSWHCLFCVERVILVYKVTGYGLDDRGSIPGRSRIFSLLRNVRATTQLLTCWITGFYFPCRKAAVT
jgi:hypothetical protein